MYRLKIYLLALIISILSLSFLISCGGSMLNTGFLSHSSSNSTGNFMLSIAWPSKSGDKYISVGTETLRLTITGDGINTSMVTSIPYGQNTVTVSNIPVGNKTAEISCLDADSNILSSRKISFVIEGGRTASSSVSLGVTVTDTGFTPETISIPAGTTLYWTNNGSNTHSLRGNSPFDNNSFLPGESRSYTFNTAGTFNYEDGSNASLTGTVVVTKTPVIASVSPAAGPVGTQVTITGTDFGDSQRNSTVIFAGTRATAISSWSDTQILCTVPSGASSDGVIVRINYVNSNNYSYDLIKYPGIYIADADNSRVVRINNMNGDGFIAVGSAGAGSYQFNTPSGLFVDDNTGYVYVADMFNNRICRFFNMQASSWSSYGSLGAGVGQFNSPQGIFVDNDGFIYITDANNNRLVRINDMTGAGWVEQSGHTTITEVTLFSNYIYICASGENRIKKISAMVSPTIDTYGTGILNYPNGIALDSQNRIYIVDDSNHRIVRIDNMTGTNFTTYGSLGAGVGQFNFPIKVKIDSSDKIYITDKANNRVTRINDMNGTGWTTYGTGGSPDGLDVKI